MLAPDIARSPDGIIRAAAWDVVRLAPVLAYLTTVIALSKGAALDPDRYGRPWQWQLIGLCLLLLTFVLWWGSERVRWRRLRAELKSEHQRAIERTFITRPLDLD